LEEGHEVIFPHNIPLSGMARALNSMTQTPQGGKLSQRRGVGWT